VSWATSAWVASSVASMSMARTSLRAAAATEPTTAACGKTWEKRCPPFAP
jgi:hypothetical protein